MTGIVDAPPAFTPAKSLLKDGDHSPAQVLATLDLADRLKAQRRAGTETPGLMGKNVALVFEKASTRTRSAFEVALRDQGGAGVYFDSTSSHMGSGESVEDTAKVLGRMFDGIAYRGFDQTDVEQLAEFSGIPVWNALTDQWHPTQALADLMTMRESAARGFGDMSVCFIGDSSDNVARSLMVSAASLGVDVRIASPAGYQPDDRTIAMSEEAAKASGGSVTVTADIDTAIDGVDFLYTDVWLSMGEKESLWEERITALRPYRIDESVIDATRNPHVKFMHCLPSFHDRATTIGRAAFEKYGLDGIEVSDHVFRSDHSIVFEQAENRLHTIKALMIESLSPRSVTGSQA
ncbi:ornithine carbamoyltransferase [Frondihabitans sp. PAMC 28766]|uniref:ornithine carbamoyltransferase n=1 Tax=Frondihabitans sp. PAMC 28766 TaxID=1795630 RepID=UPI00078B4979|nr:ornithine carbamoyltransferase [Frondihabitans sp. PAMC 28766]AMM20982.1 ornithine carbamoyltransferase [Frondihabitans sp. PAMC 28766]